MLRQDEYLDRVYAGLLGKVIGVRLGAAVEPRFWDARKIEEVYGEINYYLKEYKNFAADDDINGPLFFIRAIEEAYKENRELSAIDVGNAWLNYTAHGHGMFWWGGYGVSTEHTAFENMLKGILPPTSGSIAKNGPVVAEQIGGQIFIDTWGLLCPENPLKAAKLAAMAASVSHDRNGIYGAMFVSTCISLAFKKKEMLEIVTEACNILPENSEYRKMVEDIIRFYKEKPSNWKDCREYILDKYGADKYPGIVHIIPNGAIIVHSLLYGNGDFGRTISIAVMDGDDTDCNAGNVGTIVGVFNGSKGIDKRWRKPVNDFVATSSVIGCLNINDIPTLARYIVSLREKLEATNRSEKQIEDKSVDLPNVSFDFSLPGSTHAMRGYPENLVVISNANETENINALKATVNFIRRNNEFKIFYKPFYRRSDFSDERYMPNFSPVAYPGQTLRCKVMIPEIQQIQEILVKGYCTDILKNEWVSKNVQIMNPKEWKEVVFEIPSPLNGVPLEEIGLKFYNSGRDSFYGAVYVKDFEVFGKANYWIDPAKLSCEFGTVIPFTYNGGKWDLIENLIQGITSDSATLLTGNYRWKNYSFRARFSVPFGRQAKLVFRFQGNLKYYTAGFDGESVVVERIDKRLQSSNRRIVLAQEAFQWKNNKEYDLEITVVDDRFEFKIDEKMVISTRDSAYSHGLVGFLIEEGSRILINNISLKEL